MRTSLLLLTLSATFDVFAQPYPIGSRTATFFDASRNRNVGTEIRYPGVSAGSNVAVAPGEFPVLVMGHGFVMAVGAYANLWEHFVPKGYIMVLPTTEGSFAPSHSNFGQDLAFLATAMQAANTDASSPFHQHVAPATALMGHSMGGGASFLGASNNSAIQAVVNFAPAETTPSAIAAAANVVVPTMVFAGSNDCVTPIPQHQGPMYAALTTSCRAFVNITGGGHCYFANSNFNCDFGELTCTPNPTISRAAQHDVVNDFAGLWLDHFLKGDPDALQAVLDSISLSTRVTGQFACAQSTGIAGQTSSASIYPVPASDALHVMDLPEGTWFRVIDATGRQVLRARMMQDRAPIDVSALPAGVYHLVPEVPARGGSRFTFTVAR